jgi:hypothetical protein
MMTDVDAVLVKRCLLGAFCMVADFCITFHRWSRKMCLVHQEIRCVV